MTGVAAPLAQAFKFRDPDGHPLEFLHFPHLYLAFLTIAAAIICLRALYPGLC
jgi:hypothetical protein